MNNTQFECYCLLFFLHLYLKFTFILFNNKPYNFYELDKLSLLKCSYPFFLTSNTFCNFNI